ncbi:MAG: biotin transporter BioY [bacterium]
MKGLKLRKMIYIALFVALMTALGYVRIPLPFSPVPITGQTFGVMLAGSLLGSRLGFLALVVFNLTGLVFPVFAGPNGGPGVFLGPTGGFILSWPLAAGLIGLLVERTEKPSFLRSLGANFVGGIVLIYALGIPHFALVTNTGIGPALLTAALPFIPGDIIKCFVAALATQRLAVVRISKQTASD